MNGEPHVFVIQTENQIEAGQKKTMHLYVVAPTFEAALAAAREKYPAAQIAGVRRQDSYNGLPILTASAAPTANEREGE